MVMEADGTRPVRLTKIGGTTTHNGQPTWSPDGLKIAFASDRNGETDVYVMSSAGKALAQVTQTGKDSEPSWGAFMLAWTSRRTGDDEVFVTSVSGDGTSRFERAGFDLNLTRDAASDRQPHWTHDGLFVLFTSERDREQNVYRTNDRYQLAQVTTSLARDFAASPSPDGKHVAFASDRFEAGAPNLYTMNVDGSDVRRRTQLAGVTDTSW